MDVSLPAGPCLEWPSSSLHQQAFVELTGHEPRSEAALLSELTGLAVEVVERRALERGYRELAGEEAAEYDVATFLERTALEAFEQEDDAADEDPGALLALLEGAADEP